MVHVILEHARKIVNGNKKRVEQVEIGLRRKKLVSDTEPRKDVAEHEGTQKHDGYEFWKNPRDTPFKKILGGGMSLGAPCDEKTTV